MNESDTDMNTTDEHTEYNSTRVPTSLAAPSNAKATSTHHCAGAVGLPIWPIRWWEDALVVPHGLKLLDDPGYTGMQRCSCWAPSVATIWFAKIQWLDCRNCVLLIDSLYKNCVIRWWSHCWVDLQWLLSPLLNISKNNENAWKWLKIVGEHFNSTDSFVDRMWTSMIAIVNVSLDVLLLLRLWIPSWDDHHIVCMSRCTSLLCFTP